MGYYGLVVVTQRPQILHRSHDNLKIPYRIAYVFYMYIDTGERIAGKQDGPSLTPPPPPQIFTLWQGTIYEKLLVIFYPCYVCSVMRSYCHEILVPLGSM